MSGVSESGGRYTRSASGMVGAMVVTLGVILAFVVFRAINRDDLDYQPEPVDYRLAVEGLQESGTLRPAYPPTLPDGWIATKAAYDAESGTWKLDLLTDEGRYLGVRQARLPVDLLVKEHVGADAKAGGRVILDSAFAEQWKSFDDEDGDYAVAATVKKMVLLVVGTGDEDEIEDLAASLVVRRL
jgi:hypothetical protein